ncbi:glycoside hydrolase family 5 protein [Microbacterium sp.]|uniref:glycoside hydrolase family 5 protein n=1 Tax=Microbacterium sp. TaxID=51671 RepID=UPI0037357CB5
MNGAVIWGSITLDQGMARIARMGFNTIRLPFSNECLTQKTATSINQALNPTLVDVHPLKMMDAVIASARKYDLRVILDRHRPGSAAQSELWYTAKYPEKRWISDWKKLAVVYSPHEYPSSVYDQAWFHTKHYPNNLRAIWEKNWGFIVTKKIAPVFVGEFGTKLQTSSDKKWLAKLTRYMKDRGVGWAYWSFNPNSGAPAA